MKGLLSISESTLTLERVRQALYYDIETGILTWLIKPNRNIRVGNRAGSLKTDGYRYIRLDNVEYLEHRLIWFGMTGEWPIQKIDHKNLIKSNNKWENLREATTSENGMNTNTRKDNVSGHKGITFHQNMYRVRININNKEIYLGSYYSFEEALTVRLAKEKELQGEFAKC